MFWCNAPDGFEFQNDTIVNNDVSKEIAYQLTLIINGYAPLGTAVESTLQQFLVQRIFIYSFQKSIT